MAVMNRITVLKQFFALDSKKKLENTELMAFWKALSLEERTEYSDAAAAQLGVDLPATEMAG